MLYLPLRMDDAASVVPEVFLQLWTLLLKNSISCQNPNLISGLTVVDQYSSQTYTPGF